MKIYSQGDKAIVVSVEKEVTQHTTEDLLALRSYLFCLLYTSDAADE